MSLSYDCSTLKELIAKGGLLIDVRTRPEFDRGALSGARNIPLDSFQNIVQSIDPSVPVLLYCRSGTRSEFAKRLLVDHGFSDVHNIGSYSRLVMCQDH